MKFYTFRQNNSGGSFTVDENVAHTVVIQASDARDANERAAAIGLYFDGEGDCPCCGTRWDETSEYDGHEEPNAYGKPFRLMSEKDAEHTFGGWFNSEVRIHYADGRVLSPKSPAEVVL